MEWIETTGKTVEEAKEHALRELGIDESELEYEVTQEPRGGLLGRISGASAHVRARVRPISREKPQRGRRRGGGRGDRGKGRQKFRQDKDSRRGGGGKGGGKGRGKGSGKGGGKGGGERRSDQRGGGQQQRKKQGKPKAKQVEERSMSDVPVEEQAEMAEEFAQGLVEAFGLEGSAEGRADEDRVQVDIDGDDLGVLIGQDGATMGAIRELVKTALQRQTQGQNARVSIDVGGYNAKRRGALEAFARELAQKALDTGRAQALEPMNPPDRKVVHDAVNEIDGVTTESEGEEPRRRVVITPA